MARRQRILISSPLTWNSAGFVVLCRSLNILNDFSKPIKCLVTYLLLVPYMSSSSGGSSSSSSSSNIIIVVVVVIIVSFIDVAAVVLVLVLSQQSSLCNQQYIVNKFSETAKTAIGEI